MSTDTLLGRGSSSRHKPQHVRGSEDWQRDEAKPARSTTKVKTSRAWACLPCRQRKRKCVESKRGTSCTTCVAINAVCIREGDHLGGGSECVPEPLQNELGRLRRLLDDAENILDVKKCVVDRCADGTDRFSGKEVGSACVPGHRVFSANTPDRRMPDGTTADWSDGCVQDGFESAKRPAEERLSDPGPSLSYITEHQGPSEAWMSESNIGTSTLNETQKSAPPSQGRRLGDSLTPASRSAQGSNSLQILDGTMLSEYSLDHLLDEPIC